MSCADYFCTAFSEPLVINNIWYNVELIEYINLMLDNYIIDD